jgi:cell shape-determining protein MreC
MLPISKSSQLRSRIGVVLVLLLLAMGLDNFKVWWIVQNTVHQLQQLVLAAPKQWYSDVRHTLSAVDAQRNLLQENLQLQNQLHEAQVATRQFSELQAENAWLKQQLKVIPANQRKPAQLAKVVKYLVVPTPGHLIVDIQDQTVKSGQWVVHSGFVIGRVVKVEFQLAEVELVVASGFSAAGSIQNQPIRLNGDGGQRLMVGGLPKTVKIAEATNVLVDSKQYPELASYYLGKFKTLPTSATAAEQAAEVIMPIDLYNLNFVLILPNYAQ